MIVRNIIFFWLSGCLVVAAGSAPPGCFRAAVLDHVQQTWRSETGKTDMAKNLELNLEVYEEATKLAKEKGSDIVVFPESGLLYGFANRQIAEQFAVDIPDVNQIPCSTSNSVADTKDVLKSLSCLAVKYGIFLAANLLDKKTCQQEHVDKNDKKCPRDGRFIFNTAVLFDRQGKLIAKYHKIHLFVEGGLNPPPRPELIVVDTELGRLALQICFDIMFETPGHRMAEQHKFDTIVFPSWWFDEAPLLSSSQFQMAWAFGNNITLLASNIHNIELGSRGSGIYNGRDRKFATALYDDNVARLLIANVPIKVNSKTQCPLKPETVVVQQKIPVSNSTEYKAIYYLNMTEIEFVKLDKTQDAATVCHKGVCCTAEYRFESNDPKEHYYLMASNRTRPGSYLWSEEFCAFAQCPTEPCRRFVANMELNTKVNHVRITGNFSHSATVYPSAIGSKDQLLHPEADHWNYERIENNRYHIWYNGTGPLATLSLHGRIYQRDPPFPS